MKKFLTRLFPDAAKAAQARRWELGSLLEGLDPSGLKLTHIASYTRRGSNAGDILLPLVLRDLFDQQRGRSDWLAQHAHWDVRERDIKRFNKTSGVIIGGGGLFLSDTNQNSASGWQWPCSTELLNKIRVPRVVFAVGYNRFRGQGEFDDVFRKNLQALAEKSVYLGLRNNGSIRAIREYLPDDLRDKVRFQPCMTTLLSRMYSHLFESGINANPFIALNCAFDRSELRFGVGREKTLTEIADAMSRLSRSIDIKYYSHFDADLGMVPYLERANVPFDLVDLSGFGPRQIVEAYRQPALTIGMRGHAQMIPFGCQTPILSLVSHDKLQWFLEDIGKVEWGVDIGEEDLGQRIVAKVERCLNDSRRYAELKGAQDKLWDISVNNVADAWQAFQRV